MVKKIITIFDLLKVPDTDCIPAVFLKNCEPRLSFVLDELFNIYQKESCFPGCWKVSLVILVFKNARERSTAKNYHPVSFHSVVNKVFQKLGFWSSCFPVDLLTVCLALFHLFSAVGVHLNWLNWFHFLILEGGLLVVLIDFMIFLSPFLDFTKYLCQQFLSLHG